MVSVTRSQSPEAIRKKKLIWLAESKFLHCQKHEILIYQKLYDYFRNNIYHLYHRQEANHSQIKRARDAEDNSPIQKKIFNIYRNSLKEIQIILSIWKGAQTQL